MNLLVIFLVSYVNVFMLGFQSRVVNHNNAKLAFCNSFMIGTFQSQIWWLMDADRSLAATFVFSLSGACGIVTSMYVHKRWFTKVEK